MMMLWRLSLTAVLVALASLCTIASAGFASFERIKLEHLSLDKQPVTPYRVKSYRTIGSAVAEHDHVVLTQDQPSQTGALWSDTELMVPSWEIQMKFRLVGDEKRTNGGEGLALFISVDDFVAGAAHGFKGVWTGVGVFIDHQVGNPTKSNVNVVVNDGQKYFNSAAERRAQAVGWCDGIDVRFPDTDGTTKVRSAFLSVRSVNGMISVGVRGNDGTDHVCVLNHITNLRQATYRVGVAAKTTETQFDRHVVDSLSVMALTRELVDPTPADGKADRFYHHDDTTAYNEKIVSETFQRGIEDFARLVDQQLRYDTQKMEHFLYKLESGTREIVTKFDEWKRVDDQRFPSSASSPPDARSFIERERERLAVLQQQRQAEAQARNAPAVDAAAHHRTMNKFEDARERMQQGRGQDETLQQKIEQQNAERMNLRRMDERARRMEEMREKRDFKQFDSASMHDQATIDEITFELIKRTDRLDDQHDILDDSIDETLEEVLNQARHSNAHNQLLTEATRELLDAALRREEFEEYHRAFLEQFDVMSGQIEDLRRWSHSTQKRTDEQTRGLENFLRSEFAEMMANVQANAAQARRVESKLQNHGEALNQSVALSSSLGTYALYGLVIIAFAILVFAIVRGRSSRSSGRRMQNDWSKGL